MKPTWLLVVGLTAAPLASSAAADWAGQNPAGGSCGESHRALRRESPWRAPASRCRDECRPVRRRGVSGTQGRRLRRVVQENEADCTTRLREPASKLSFTLTAQASRFALYRDVDVSKPVRTPRSHARRGGRYPQHLETSRAARRLMRQAPTVRSRGSVQTVHAIFDWSSTMVATDKLFAGSIPRGLRSFLGSADLRTVCADLAERVAKVKPRDVLETAAGTGVLTRAIASQASCARAHRGN